MSDVRQRNVQKPDEGAVLQKVPTTVPDPDLAKRVKEEDDAFSLLDIARTCVLLLLVLSAVSWLVTRDSFTFNVPRPNFTRLDVIKTWIVCSPPSDIPHIYTNHLTERTSRLHRQRSGTVRRNRSYQANLPSNQRHDLRCDRWRQTLRPRRLLPFLRRCRCLPRLCHELLQRRPHSGYAGRGGDVHPA